MNKRKTIISIILTFFILLAGMGIYKIWSKREKVTITNAVEKEILRQVPLRQLQTTSAINRIRVDGRLSAYEKVNISANVSGVLLAGSTPLKAGMHFKKGALLFDIDQRKAIFNLYAQRSSLLNAITLIMPDLKVDYPDAYPLWKKYLDDFKIESAVQALPKIKNDREKYLIASRNIFRLFYNIKSAEAQLADYKIYAPFNGVVTRADVFPGTMVLPGQPLAELINIHHYELEVPIPESNLAFIKIGNTAHLSAQTSERNWTGKVVRISNQIDPTTQSIPVYISVSGAGLKEGMYLKGDIIGIPLQDVISIPKNYIVNQQYIYTAKDSILSLQSLTIKNRDELYIYANSIGSDIWIVDTDPRGLFEGQKIIPVFK